MRKEKIKKVYILLLACVVAMSCLSLGGCSKKPEGGQISDVDIVQPEDGEAAPGFIKADSPYENYTYKTFTLKKARMSFDVPENWTVEFRNSRCVTMITPEVDGFVPGMTFNLLINYGIDTSDNELSGSILNNQAYMFSDYFKQELEGLPFYIQGNYRHLRNYVAEDVLDNGLDIVDEDHKSDAATLVVNSVTLMDKANNYYSNFGMVETYFKWRGDPCLLVAVTPYGSNNDVRKMSEYIVSSITYADESIGGYKDVSFEDFSTKVPNSLSPAAAGNVFWSSPDDNELLSGMSVSVYKVDGAEGADMTAENIAEVFGPKIAAGAFADYPDPVEIGTFAHEGEDKDGPDFTGTVNILPVNRSALDYAGRAFGGAAYYTADYYVRNEGGTNYIITVLYQSPQKDLARAIGQTAVKNFKIAG